MLSDLKALTRTFGVIWGDRQGGDAAEGRGDDGITPRDAEAFAMTGRARAGDTWSFKRMGALEPALPANAW